jgi:hypothetical protein
MAVSKKNSGKIIQKKMRIIAGLFLFNTESGKW